MIKIMCISTFPQSKDNKMTHTINLDKILPICIPSNE